MGQGLFSGIDRRRERYKLYKMSFDKFKRVLWRLREMTTKQPGLYTNKQIRLAIMEEIGTDERTIKVTIEKMVELRLMKAEGFGMMKLSWEHAQE